MISKILILILVLWSFSAQAIPNRIYFKSSALRSPFANLVTDPVRRVLLPNASGPQLLYFGGPVISNVKVVSVFWTNKVDATVQKQIGNFYGTMTNSTYMDWLTEYDTNITAQGGAKGTKQSIGRGTYAGNFIITPSVTSGTIDDTAIQSELIKQIAAGKLPTPDENSLFMVHFPPGITVTMDGYTSCQDFCAYHGGVKDGTKDLYYGVMPDFASSACSQGCGNSDDFSNFTSAASHEVMEAVTDSQVAYVTSNEPTAPMAWYDPSYGESGDICVGTNGTVKGTAGSFNVQGIWSNAKNECVQAPGVAATGTPESFNFR